jgi:cell division protein ZapA
VADDTSRVVTVEIMGRRYQIRSALDLDYISDLASYVDEKIQAVAARSTGGDTVRVAVLAALNIADEYFRIRDADENLSHDAMRRAGEIERMVDLAIEQFG